jgi:hypothetical protein
VAPIAAWKDPVDIAGKLADEITFPQPVPEGSSEDEMMFYAKACGVGIAGTVLVLVIARALMGGGNKRRAAPSPLRRPGLPR